MLGHPDLQEMDPIKKLDVQLVKEWEAKAKEKLLENVQVRIAPLTLLELLYSPQGKASTESQGQSKESPVWL